MKFQRYIGIDYSGAETSESRLKALQLFEATVDDGPVKVNTPTQGAKNWSRLEIAQYCLRALESGEPVIIGIDHGFSFPLSYMQRYGLSGWDAFLQDFMRHWPTADPHTYVDFVRENNPRTGRPSELRLCEQWTTTRAGSGLDGLLPKPLSQQHDPSTAEFIEGAMARELAEKAKAATAFPISSVNSFVLLTTAANLRGAPP